MSDEKNFRVKVYKTRHGSISRSTAFSEPIEAVEEAEYIFSAYGVIGSTTAEIVFNGDPEPHFLLFYLGKGRTGIYNTDACKWPIFYPEGSLAGKEDSLTEIPWPVKEGEGESKEEKSKVEKAEGQDFVGSEGKKESEDFPESEDEGSEDEEDGTGEDDGDDEDGGDDGSNSEDDPGKSDGEGESESEEEEMKLPRMTLFSKMRGPKGWRKRAETEELLDMNSFQWKVGVIENGKESRRKRGQMVQAMLVERDDDRVMARFVLQIPTEAELTYLGNGRYIADIPIPRED